MAQTAEDYPWSSAAAHCGRQRQAWLDTTLWSATWTPEKWRAYLTGGSEHEAEEIRANTRTGRPRGSAGCVQKLERRLGRRLASQKGGRTPARTGDARQQGLSLCGEVTETG